MKSSNPSATNLGKIEKKQPHNTKKKNNNKNSPKSPLKVRDLNTASSASSSSSVSIDASRGGCLRFLLSHPHSSSAAVNAKIGTQKLKSSLIRTPKSAPNVKNLSNMRNSENPIVRLRNRAPPRLRSGVVEKCSSGARAKLSNNGGNLIGSECELEKLGGINEGLELVDDEINNESDCNSPIFPIQASVSPEIQGGSMSTMASATPGTCYAAGYVLSGVSDRRKCRPRGILTVGDNDLFDSSKTNVSELPRLPLAPSPFRASMHWFSSPNDEKRVEEEDKDNQCGGFSVPFTSVGCSSSSPLSSLGFSSEFFNRSNSTFTTSDHSSRRSMSCVLSHESTSKFRGLLGPSFDHLVCSPLPSSPISSPSSKDLGGSGNVIQTPTSTTSSSNIGSWDLSKDNVSRPLFERELDSLGESLAGASFEFTPLIEQNVTGFPESMVHNVPTSTKEGSENYVSDIDDSDCCKCFSDEEEEDPNLPTGSYEIDESFRMGS